MPAINWKDYAPYFRKEEFDCKHTGKNLMRKEFMDVMMQARVVYQKPIIITSGYRDPSHPVERIKDRPGEHTYGLAADIDVSRVEAMDLMVIFYHLGIRRFGLDQKGPSRFMHVGLGDKLLGFPQSLWTY